MTPYTDHFMEYADYVASQTLIGHRGAAGAILEAMREFQADLSKHKRAWSGDGRETYDVAYPSAKLTPMAGSTPAGALCCCGAEGHALARPVTDSEVAGARLSGLYPFSKGKP